MRRAVALITLILGLTLLAAPPASAAVAAHVENRTSGSPSGSNNLVGIEPRLSEEAVRENVRLAYELASGSPVAIRGGATPVRIGQRGEAAVRDAYDIGPKATREISGRTRIFDGLNTEAVAEIKNVARLSFTEQLRDTLAYAQENNLRFDLYVRGGTQPTILSGPLARAIAQGQVNLMLIP